MDKTLVREGKKKQVVRITDAHPVADVHVVLRGSGMFGERRVVVLDSVFVNAEARTAVLGALEHMAKSEELFFILEEKLDAATKRIIEKYAESSERFDTKSAGGGSAFGGKKSGEIFALAHALKRGDKKRLWVEYQRALLRDEAPEAIHGVLFWGAKDMVLRAKARSPEHRRGAELIAQLAELPHEARRQGFELEYALERYLLGLSH